MKVHAPEEKLKIVCLLKQRLFFSNKDILKRLGLSSHFFEVQYYVRSCILLAVDYFVLGDVPKVNCHPFVPPSSPVVLAASEIIYTDM